MEFVRKHKTQTGHINVSCPELTAVDLVENEKSVGGLNRVCTVLNELAETMDLNSLDDSFSRHRPYRSFNVWVIFWNMYWKERIWQKPYIPKWRLQD